MLSFVLPDASLRRGIALVLSSPSGAGKTTLTRNLIESDPKVHLSVSVTTRPRRPSEIDGVHYKFISHESFYSMRDRGELLEWAEVHGHLYGTPFATIEEKLKSGYDVAFDIDWQGALQLSKHLRGDVVSVFVLPPSMAELTARLKRRAEDHHDIIEQRLKNACEEMAHWNEYDYVIVNHDLNVSFHALTSILMAERLKKVRNPSLEPFVLSLTHQGSLKCS